jgi:hypothetical protein
MGKFVTFEGIGHDIQGELQQLRQTSEYQEDYINNQEETIQILLEKLKFFKSELDDVPVTTHYSADQIASFVVDCIKILGEDRP